jgi:hypothetical protein
MVERSVLAGSHSRNSSSTVGVAMCSWVVGVRPGHKALIRALSSVSSSRMRLMASISPISIPGQYIGGPM